MTRRVRVRLLFDRRPGGTELLMLRRAVRMRENTFRQKYARYIKSDPQNPDRKRKALCAVAAKVARVAHGLIKTGTDYRPYFEAIPPSGALRSLGPSSQALTS